MSTPNPEENRIAVEPRQQSEQALSADRRKILALPPEKALEVILAHPYPVTLVQSMAEEDLYLLVHAIGPEDAMPILGLASNVQWEYFLDMEIWARDRIHSHALTEWLARLLKADPDRFTHWIAGEQRDIFEYYLLRNVELHVREYEEDPAEVGDGFATEDDVHYIRMRPYPTGHEPHQEARDRFLGDLLKRLSVYDYSLYRNLLLESATVLPADAEEELLRLRNLRLAEKGFLPFEEAVGVYQPLDVAVLLRRGRKATRSGGRPVESYPLPVHPTGAPDGAGRFAAILARIQDDALLLRLQTEFAALCNQVITADLQQIRERESLARVVQKVADYIGIGLEKADQAADEMDPYRGANLLQSHLLADIFRVGYGSALALKWKADRWRRDSWFNRAALPLSFWGEAWLGVLGGLLIKKPLYYDNYATGVLYREFLTLDDIRATETILDRIVAFDDLLSRMAVEMPRFEGGSLITCQNVLLTMWVNHALGMASDRAVPIPLTLAQFRDFFDRLWLAGSRPRRIKDSMREHCLDWLAARSGSTTADLATRMGPALDALFTVVENELGPVASKDLDPRYVQHFLLKD